MGKETEKILQLLNYWQAFTRQNEGDIFSFAKWLTKIAEEQEQKVENDSSRDSPSQKYIHHTYSIDDQLTLLWGRLIRYTHLWSRKALQNLHINSVEEYGLLKSVQLLKKARKSELIKFSLLESTTCFEMIKRLEKAGYLRETVDTLDKRSRLVSLTAKGKKTIVDADLQMKKLSNLLMGDLDEVQKHELLEMLRQLNVFHENLYQADKNASLDDMLNQKQR
ncbi:DNA-binding MarR family transcriptional regulator [Catalinimonas alkaloidigena]|uniref:MarR family winged helix-turn-helix transcriptional regulator n=1 Tax=Catalinimonas alkaloidigena TaxID=1075417 RepID=UPI0024069431|nr:winged helix DNA-binding protein [Catalinimonas alkaloidigena]MDF9796868.1 DNA-binding MarR family transcriptional regulator [Catalinimonas alkaloidigena]